MELLDVINELIYKKPLYEKIGIKCDELKIIDENWGWEPEYDFPGDPFKVVNIPVQIEKILDFIFKSSKIYGNCPHCKKDNVLISDSRGCINSLYEPIYNIPLEICDEYDFEGLPGKIDLLLKLSERINNQIYKEIDNGIFMKKIKCSHCGESAQIIFKLEIIIFYDKKEIIIFLQKIGQYPQFYKWKKDKKIFDKILEQIKAKEDYTYAINSAEDGYYIGAYTYLRRVLEKYFLKKYNCAIQQGDSEIKKINKQDFEKMNYEYKKDLLKSYIVSECVEYGKLFYENISKGIHKLDENYCKENYDTFINAINIIIESEDIKQKKYRIKENTISELNALSRKNGS